MMKCFPLQVVMLLLLVSNHEAIAKQRLQHNNPNTGDNKNRHLQAWQGGLFTPTNFCAPSSNGVYETVKRNLFLAWLSRLFRRQWRIGSCEEVCSDICEHQDCMDDYIISSTGETCECLLENSSPKCGNGAFCIKDTCQCEEGLFGDPFVKCEASSTEVTAPSKAPTQTISQVTTSAPTIASLLTEAQFCVEGGYDCPDNRVCCDTTSGKSCLKPEECCTNGKVFDPLCGCMAVNEVCCGDLKIYLDVCPCEVIGGTFCHAGYNCIKFNRGLSGECIKEEICNDSSQCSTNQQCCDGKCISETECCSACNDLTEQCCNGSCIPFTQCCESIDGKACIGGGCANDPDNNSRCCLENKCGVDDCCIDGEEECRNETECVPIGHTCSRFDPCCNPQSCTDYAGVIGDPHIGTFDGLSYDCQATGEFVLARSVNSDFKVNGFFKEVSSNDMTVSVLNGIAVQPSGKGPLIQLIVDERQVRLWVGGSEIMDAGSGFAGNKTEVKKRYDNYYDIFCEDASIEITVLEWKVGLVLNLLMKLKKKSTNRVIGLLGTPDGNLNNEWVELFGEFKYSDKVQICSNADECTSKMASDYCITNWCVSTLDDSMFRLHDGISFYEETGCRAPLSYQTTVVIPQSRRLQSEANLEALCGNDLACILDASLFGYDAAKSAVIAQTRLLDSMVIDATPNRFIVNETTPATITLTLSRDEYENLYLLSGDNLKDSQLAYVLFIVDSKSGIRDLSLTKLLEHDKGKSNARVVAFTTYTNFTFASAGEFYGFEAVPSFRGVLNNSLSKTSGNAIRSYTDLGTGACFRTNLELSDAVVAYTIDSSREALVTKVYGMPIGSWCVSKLQDFSSIFLYSSLNEDLNNWDVSQATTMRSMFYNSSYNKDLNKWDVRKVRNMWGMFSGNSSFSANISNWDVSSVTDMAAMFASNTVFNSRIKDWNVSQVTTMLLMFKDSSNFDQDLNNWNVENVKDMYGVFYNASSFSRDISSWNLNSVTRMNLMFRYASSFNQSLCAWGAQLFNRMVTVVDMFDASGCMSTDIPELTVSPVTPLCHTCPA